jgi:hypothetical protein
VSWELEEDLRELVGSTASNAIDRFDERNAKKIPLFPDGTALEYFPPEYLQIDRILDFVVGDEPLTELSCVPVPGLHGSNCSVTIKWRGIGYEHASFENVRDLQVGGIDYRRALEIFLQTEARKHCLHRHVTTRIKNSIERSESSAFDPIFPNGNRLYR